MTFILHGTWLPDQKQFFLWGESLEVDAAQGETAEAPPASISKFR